MTAVLLSITPKTVNMLQDLLIILDVESEIKDERYETYHAVCVNNFQAHKHGSWHHISLH